MQTPEEFWNCLALCQYTSDRLALIAARDAEWQARVDAFLEDNNRSEEQVKKQFANAVSFKARAEKAEAQVEKLDAEVRRLRAMLDEAECNQSATRNHAEVLYRRLVAAQDALIAYPSIVTRLVRGSYGIDVNEHQIDAWLRGVMSKDAEKELAAHDARLLDEAAERLLAKLGIDDAGYIIHKCRPVYGRDIRAAIKGAAHE